MKTGASKSESISLRRHLQQSKKESKAPDISRRYRKPHTLCLLTAKFELLPFKALKSLLRLSTSFCPHIWSRLFKAHSSRFAHLVQKSSISRSAPVHQLRVLTPCASNDPVEQVPQRARRPAFQPWRGRLLGEKNHEALVETKQLVAQIADPLDDVRLQDLAHPGEEGAHGVAGQVTDSNLRVCALSLRIRSAWVGKRVEPQERLEEAEEAPVYFEGPAGLEELELVQEVPAECCGGGTDGGQGGKVLWRVPARANNHLSQ
jgi:hypothetical protein